ncbi:class I SAM-dependent methyltransferase [bacterium]|nr:class I SAM-dependent methyltransferase [bacterium]
MILFYKVVTVSCEIKQARRAPFPRVFIVACLLILNLSGTKSIRSQTLGDGEDEGRVAAVIPEPLESYMGREIAQTMHYTGAEWLIRDRREREERCSLMLANLGVKSGMAICDMGCGNGFHTLKLAEMTGKLGYVAGVDVQPQMLMLLRKRMEESGIENVVPILGSYHNPRLPRASLDLILLVDVYHEFSHPKEMLAAMRDSLKPDGLIVLVEYREEDPEVPIKPKHKMSKAQVDKELTANGFELKKSFDKLPWQHMLFYGIAEYSDVND